MRRFYFSLAAIWGFVIGGGGLAAALAFVGSPAAISTRALLALLPALLVAVAGGWVTASTYREARNRMRR
jgi:hypothetical protein